MKIIIILIGLVLLSGCNKSDWFGYTSFSHCRVETLRTQPNVVKNSAINQASYEYCAELFPNQISLTDCRAQFGQKGFTPHGSICNKLFPRD